MCSAVEQNGHKQHIRSMQRHTGVHYNPQYMHCDCIVCCLNPSHRLSCRLFTVFVLCFAVCKIALIALIASSAWSCRWQPPALHKKRHYIYVFWLSTPIMSMLITCGARYALQHIVRCDCDCVFTPCVLSFACLFVCLYV